MGRSLFSRIMLIVLVVFLLAGMIIPAYGSEIDDLNDKLQKNEQKQDQLEKEIKDARATESSLLGQLQSLDQKIETLAKSLEKVNSDLKEAESKVVKAEAELKRAEAELAQKSEFLSQRIRDIYMNGSVSFLEVLFSSSSFTDFVTRFEYMKRIAEQDADLVREVKKEKAIIQTEKKILTANRDKIKALKNQQVREESEMLAQKHGKENLLQEIKSDEARSIKLLDELEAESDRLAEMIRVRSSGNPSYGNGPLAWPVPGYHSISSKYGMRFHPILKKWRLHNGIDIAIPKGTPIVAAQAGKVICVGERGGFGYIVAIDHGGGLSTLYAHLSAQLVSEGQMVAKGERIALSGGVKDDLGSGLSTGPHLHFTVYDVNNPSPLDPKNKSADPLNYL